jgi:succinyl-diaminopimelate desuccinylase
MTSRKGLAVAIAQQLIRCPSVTPSEGGALRYLRATLEAAGFSAHRVSFADPHSPPVENLYARFGTRSPHLVFAGHTDVVPPGDREKWRFDPFAGHIAEGMLWGRGACDMKGGVAAAVAAVLSFLAKRPAFSGSIGFLLTGDEEGPAINGTAKLLQWVRARGDTIEHCLLGEPTNLHVLGDMVKIGRRGSLTGMIRLHGTQGHVAYPQLADNPIPHLLRILTAITGEALDKGSAFFDASNLEITSVDVGNTVANIIPAEARAVFNIRFNDQWSPITLAAEIRRRCESAARHARFTLAFESTNAVAFLTEPGHFTALVVGAIKAVTGQTPTLSTSGGTSDARFIQTYCPVVEFGLVGQTMHAVDERAALSDIEQLSAVYERVLESYFAVQSDSLPPARQNKARAGSQRSGRA